MSVLIDEKLEEIAAACQRYGIERLFVFGSALREDFRPGDFQERCHSLATFQAAWINGSA
jgi:hypothetical protein